MLTDSDRIFEMLWSFHRANIILDQVDAHPSIFLPEMSRRTVRMTTEDELNSFAEWVSRQPADNYNSYGAMDQGFWAFDNDDPNHEFDEDD